MSPPRLTLVVNTFNQPEYLRRVLHGISRQTTPPFEVIVADDGSEKETAAVFLEWAAAATIRNAHVWQEHAGFRRSQILNKAIARASGDYVVFLDGDSLPHPSFVNDHLRLAATGHFVQGHRALIEKKGAEFFGKNEFSRDRRSALFSGQLRGLKHAYRWPLPLRRKRTDLKGIRGCNLAIWREDLLRVNGYNEAFVGWGREDSELALRLINSEVVRLDVRGWALCYHLWHPPASRQNLGSNDELLAEAVRQKVTRCDQGLDQQLTQR